MKYLILICAVILLLTACQSNTQTENPTNKKEVTVTSAAITLTKEQVANAGIEVGKAELASIATTLKLNGKIELPPQNIVSVNVPMGGYLLSTPLITGMSVRKGQLIAVVEDQQYIQLQQDYLNNLNQLVLAESEYQRQKLLNETKSSSDKSLQQSEMMLKNLKISVRSLKERLQMIGIQTAALSPENISGKISIYSPINGYVTKVTANIGKFIQPTEVLFEIIDLSDMHLVLTVFEKDLPNIQIGDEVIAYTNQYPEIQFPATVILIGRDISSERTVELHCHFKGKLSNLIPGTYMNADLTIENKDAVIIPEESIVSKNNQTFIFTSAGENTFKMQEVNTGTNDNGMTEILSPKNLIKENIVFKGSYWLLMHLENQNSDE